MSEQRNRYDEVPTDSLVGADYNPNTMTRAAFEALVTEVREKRWPLKPIVVRSDGSRLIIVDGHFNWTAARVAGLPTVPIEIIEADEFEARRQTLVRNRTGRKDSLLLGRVYRDMLTERNLTNRELGDMLGVSEGSIRNQLLYAQAWDLLREKGERITANTEAYQWQGRTYTEHSSLDAGGGNPQPITKLGVRDVRALVASLQGLADDEQDQPGAAEPEARILKRLKRAWDAATEPERREFIMWTGMLAEVDQVEKDAYERGYTEGRDATLRSVKAGQAKAPEAGDQPDDEARNGYAERGARIKAAREQRGWSRRQLGKMAGIAAQQAGLAERGLVKQSGRPAFAKLEAALGIGASDGT